jgi:hypothetical protein
VKDSIEVRRKIYCARHGHSNVIGNCFGYISCGRCGDQIGDTLAGCYSNDKAVLVGHFCKTCTENAKKLTKHDLALLPKEAAGYVDALLSREASHV